MSKNGVAKSAGAPLPTHLAGVQMSGAGVPTDQKDFLIPLARVLDPKSPEVEKRGVNYVPGAEPGDILIKNSPVPLIKGETGFLFQPCHRDEAIIEWVPRTRGGGGGGGFAGRHPADFLTAHAADCEQRPHPENPEKKVWFRKSTGNMLVETRYYGGYMLSETMPPIPLVLAFASTGHTVAKQWNMLLATKLVNGQPADIFAVIYRVKTRLRQRGDQAWYLFDITDAGPVDEATKLPTTLWVPTIEDYNRGKALHASLKAGEKAFESGTSDAATSDDKM